MSRQVPDDHQSTRILLRVFGVLLILAGVISIATAIMDFFSVQGTFGAMPTKSHYFFIGIPLLFAGSVMANYGFMGAVAKYQSRELTPVISETINDLAEGTQSGIRTVSKSIAEGVKQAAASQSAGNEKSSEMACGNCGTFNDSDAKFCKSCKSCGEPVVSAKICLTCQHANDADAAYCTECGGKL